jgi:hypothetical protein
MAKQPQPGEFLVDGIGPLDAGVNTGLAPQLLPSNQVAMSTNMTFRGGYGTHRPVLREINFDFKGDLILQESVIHKPFQGACFYQPDTGAQSLVAAIGGHLFQFFPSGTTAPVLDVSIPGDPNPTSPQQAWLWQSERFVIWNDGVSLPVFFDGSFSRRSNGPNSLIGTIVGSFVAPAVGGTVDVLLTALYSGSVNIPVIVNGSQYVLLGTGVSTAPSAKVTVLYDTPHTYPVGTQLIAYANQVAVLLSDFQPSFSNMTVNTSIMVDVNDNQIALGTNVSLTNAFGNTHLFSVVSISDAFFPGTKTVVLHLISGRVAVPTDTLGQIILAHHPGEVFTISSSAPNPAVGTLAAAFTTIAPTPIGQVINISLNPTYTGPRQVVWIGSAQYLIEQIPFTPTSTVTLKNIGATPGAAVSGDITALPELPPGRMGTYGLGRNWMALTDGTSFIASDIVGGTSGTEVYNFRDAPLRVTENSYLAGGGAFRVPGALGDIRAMRFSATLDVSLGQGPLQVFTTQAAFSCNAPVDRTTWATITNPILTQSLLGAGALSQNGTTNVNGDILFRAIDGIRSLILARRDFDTWGNVPQSREVETILAQDDATLVQFESLVQFDNRALLSILPTNGPLGIFHQGVIALNEDPISTLRGKAPSIYDGLWTGLNVLQLVTGVFNGVERCYAFCFDSVLSRIRLFEIQKTDAAPFDNDTTPVTYSFESPALFNNTKIKNTFDLCELVDGEIYISDLRGVANFEIWYRPNYSDCWTKWTSFGVCGNNTDTSKPIQYRSPIGLGSPSVSDCDPNTKQPTRIGITFQVRIQITGSCKFRGARFKAVAVPETRFTVVQCKPLCVVLENSSEPDCEPCREQNTCLQFPLVLYNLNANKSYSNEPTTVNVKCPDGTIQQVPVPSNTINYTLPFAPGFTGDYPPLIMNCLSGGVIVKTIPSGATQDQIDLIVNEMIAGCVQAYAQSIAQCGSPSVLFSSEQVTTTHTCPDGDILAYTGTLPSWISFDENTGVITGNAGVITSEISAEDATAKAQAQLDTWVQAQLDNGNLHCQSALPPPSIVFVPTEASGWDEFQTAYGFVEQAGLLYGIGDINFYSTNDGVNFTSVSAHGVSQPTSLAFGAGVFVAGTSSFLHRAWSSPDGVTWTLHAAGCQPIFVAFGNGIFVGVGDGINVTVSPDGAAWTNQAVLPMSNPRAIDFGAGVFVAAGAGGLATSADGVTWTTNHFGNYRGVAFVDNQFIAVGSSGIVATSPDGIIWTDQTSGVAGDFASVGGGNGTLLAVTAFGSSNGYTSTDGGVSWSFLREEANDDFPSLIKYYSVANVIDAGFFV